MPLLNKVRTVPLGVSQGSEAKSTGSPQLAQIVPGLPTRGEPTSNPLQIGLQGTLNGVTGQVDSGNTSALISKDACIHSALLRHEQPRVGSRRCRQRASCPSIFPYRGQKRIAFFSTLFVRQCTTLLW